MPFPEDVLAPNETARLNLRPHWIVFVGIGIRLLLWACLLFAASLPFVLLRERVDDPGAMLRFLFVVSVVGELLTLLSFIPALIRFLTMRYLVTTDRVFQQHGLLSRNGRDVPLLQVSAINFRQSLLGRILRYGDLLIESPVSGGAIRFRDVRNPRQVRAEIYRLIDERAPRPEAGESR
jgi:membrane protein YdbS with pleckstrin-like domain